MTTWGVLATVLVATAAWLLVPARPMLTPRSRSMPPPGPAPAQGWLRQGRWLWAGLAGAATWGWLGGRLGLVLAPVGAGVAWWIAVRSPPAGQRRHDDAARAQLPHLVALLAATLRAGAAVETSLGLVCDALPGAAANRLMAVRARIAVGVDPGDAWAELATDPVLAPLGRTLARSHRTGAAVADAVASLGEQLAAARRAQAEDRARAVGVKAALPLGLCLLPSFILLGIVPTVAGLVTMVLRT
ncbi:MAG: type II secretion system F family protein [Nocardioidaceae bacterium]